MAKIQSPRSVSIAFRKANIPNAGADHPRFPPQTRLELGYLSAYDFSFALQTTFLMFIKIHHGTSKGTKFLKSRLRELIKAEVMSCS